MSLHESAEMYLETIYTLSLTKTHVRSVDVAEALNYSRPSVSRAVGLLKKDGYGGLFFWSRVHGNRKGGRPKAGKEVSGGHFFSPWEIP